MLFYFTNVVALKEQGNKGIGDSCIKKLGKERQQASCKKLGHKSFLVELDALDYSEGDPQVALKDTRIFDSGCSRHMTGNKSYLLDYQDYDEDCCIAGSLMEMCDKKNSVLFTEIKCLILSFDFKLPDENQVMLKIHRKDNMYSFDLKNVVPSKGSGQNGCYDINILTNSNRNINRSVQEIETIGICSRFRTKSDAGQVEKRMLPDREYNLLIAAYKFQCSSDSRGWPITWTSNRNSNTVVPPLNTVSLPLNTVGSPVNTVSSSFTTVDPRRAKEQRNDVSPIPGQQESIRIILSTTHWKGGILLYRHENATSRNEAD
ncbi:hypothetical protein Tco_0453084 [Tanacetum coccineum]